MESRAYTDSSEIPSSEPVRGRTEIHPLDVSSFERSILLSQLQQALRFYLSRDIPVYLEDFGILYTKIVSAERTYLLGDRLVVRRERSRSFLFDKCSNLTAYHRGKYSGIVETREISERICAALPIEIALTCPDPLVRRLVKHLISDIKREATTRGHASELAGIGSFFALHNRQGSTLEDWFAGADIFLKSTNDEMVSVGPCSVFERPVLENAWELLQAAYGAPICTFAIDLSAELRDLGYDVSELPQEVEREVRVAVFATQNLANQNPASQNSGNQNFSTQSGDAGNHTLIYCTDGLRRLGLRSSRSRGFGTELVFHLPVKSSAPFRSHTVSGANSTSKTSGGLSESAPRWPSRVFTLGWILMQGSKSRTVLPGARHSENISIVRGFDTDLKTILATPFPKVREQQLSSEGPFFYVNLIGITDEESALAAEHSAEHLVSLLEQRGLATSTKPTRSSITVRSSYNPTHQSARRQHMLVDPRLGLGSRSALESLAN